MRLTLRPRRWWVGAYLLVTFASTAGWLILGQRLAEETGLRRQVWLANDFQGRPFIDDVARAPTLDFLDDDSRLPREFISARWQGYWYVPSRQSFTLHVHADDYADVRIDGELLFARSSAAARAVRLDAGVHELQIAFQQYAGSTGLEFYEGSGSAYPLPLRTGYLFPNTPEPNLLRLATIVDRLKLTAGILLAAGVLGALVLIVRRRRAAVVDGTDALATAPTRLDAAVLTVLCLAILVYGFSNLSLYFARADGLQNLRLGIMLAQDGTYRQFPREVDDHSREPLGPSLIALTDIAAAATGFGALPIECVGDETETLTRSDRCRRQYVPYQATNLVLLVLGALGVFWLVLRLTGRRTLAYFAFLLTAQSAALLASADSFYTEVHAATLMVAVGGLAWLTATSRRLMLAALLGLALAALVLTKVVFTYLWIPIALALVAADLLRRRLDWTTAGLIGVMLVAQSAPSCRLDGSQLLGVRRLLGCRSTIRRCVAPTCVLEHYAPRRVGRWFRLLPPTHRCKWLVGGHTAGSVRAVRKAKIIQLPKCRTSISRSTGCVAPRTARRVGRWFRLGAVVGWRAHRSPDRSRRKRKATRDRRRAGRRGADAAPFESRTAPQSRRAARLARCVRRRGVGFPG